ncbi:hypothetical protein BGX26_008590 [Mortierella sp. AD094]|nr:hypothetical protein BGX26_008590 [Mortierella sp. AD094]
MNRSTAQPISIRPSPPVKTDFRHPSGIKSTTPTPQSFQANTNKAVGASHICGESEGNCGNGEGGDDGTVQNLSMDLANRLNSAAWDRAPAAGVGLPQMNYQHLRHHRTSSSPQLSNTCKEHPNNVECNKAYPRESKRTDENRPAVSIDTSPASLLRRPGPHPRTNIQAVPPSVETGQKKKFLDQAGDTARQFYPVSWPRTPLTANSTLGRREAKSQLSLGLSKDKSINTAKSDSSSFDSLDPSLSPSQSLLATEETTDKPTKTSTLQRKSSLTWRLPLRAKVQSPNSPSISCSHAINSKAYVTSPDRLFTPDGMGERSSSVPTKRPCRSKSVSSLSSKETSSPSRSSNHSLPVPVITSLSYNSLPYSPAVAFLSNFVDATAPVVAPDEEGSQVGNYVMGKVIGHGGFSIVREAATVDLDDGSPAACVAVKIVKTQTGARDNDRVQKMLDKEITIWSQVSHLNILPFIAVEKLPTSTFIFCELCTGGHLLHYLTYRDAPSPTSPTPRTTQPLGEDEARGIFNQIAEAVRYLHEEKRIVHRDIKLENILQHENGTWKICDFGLAEYQDEDAATCFGDTLVPSRRASICGVSEPTHDSSKDTVDEVTEDSDEDEIKGGSLAYSSPEQLRCHKPLRCPLSDVWSLGIVLYALLTGKLPFQDEYEPRLQLQILNGRYEEPVDCGPEARDLLRGMFRLKPEDRWHIGQVRDSHWCTGTSGIDLDHSLNSSTGSSESRPNFSSFRSTL